MSLRFIDSGGLNGLRKLEGKERRLVRSHVMKGRNLNKIIRRGKCNQQKRASQSLIYSTSAAPHKDQNISSSSLIPGRVGNEWTGFQFAFELKPYMRHAIFNFLTGLSEVLYPMQVCLPRDPTADIWFMYSLVEPAYLHCVLALSIEMMDELSLTTWKARPTALFHLGEALRLANEKLHSQQQGLLPDHLFAVITSLAISDSCRGDLNRALIHLDGIQCMLEHVGGFSYLDGNPSLQSKILRFDIDYSVRTGSQPRFYFDAVESPTAAILFNRQPSPCPDFESTFNHLRTFTLTLERQLSSSVHLDPNSFHTTVISIYYRLLALPPLHGVQEALRLASLAFMTTWFGYGYRVRYSLLGAQLRDSVLLFDDVSFEGSSSLLWILFVGAIGVFSDGEVDQLSQTFTSTLENLGLKSWNETMQYLKQFPWVSRLHEKAAHKVWERIA